MHHVRNVLTSSQSGVSSRTCCGSSRPWHLWLQGRAGSPALRAELPCRPTARTERRAGRNRAGSGPGSGGTWSGAWRPDLAQRLHRQAATPQGEAMLFLGRKPGQPPSPGQVRRVPAEGKQRVSGALGGRVGAAGPLPPRPLPLRALTWARPASVGRRGVLQAQQLPHESLAKLHPAVPLHVVGVRHLVQDVGVVDGDADGEPEHLLPGLVGFVGNEIPAGTPGVREADPGGHWAPGSGLRVPKGLLLASRGAGVGTRRRVAFGRAEALSQRAFLRQRKWEQLPPQEGREQPGSQASWGSACWGLLKGCVLCTLNCFPKVKFALRCRPLQSALFSPRACLLTTPLPCRWRTDVTSGGLLRPQGEDGVSLLGQPNLGPLPVWGPPCTRLSLLPDCAASEGRILHTTHCPHTAAPGTPLLNNAHFSALTACSSSEDRARRRAQQTLAQ